MYSNDEGRGETALTATAVALDVRGMSRSPFHRSSRSWGDILVKESLSYDETWFFSAKEFGILKVISLSLSRTHVFTKTRVTQIESKQTYSHEEPFRNDCSPDDGLRSYCQQC